MACQEEQGAAAQLRLGKNKAQEPSSALKHRCLPMMNALSRCLAKMTRWMPCQDASPRRIRYRSPASSWRTDAFSWWMPCQDTLPRCLLKINVLPRYLAKMPHQDVDLYNANFFSKICENTFYVSAFYGHTFWRYYHGSIDERAVLWTDKFGQLHPEIYSLGDRPTVSIFVDDLYSNLLGLR